MVQSNRCHRRKRRPSIAEEARHHWLMTPVRRASARDHRRLGDTKVATQLFASNLSSSRHLPGTRIHHDAIRRLILGEFGLERLGNLVVPLLGLFASTSSWCSPAEGSCAYCAGLPPGSRRISCRIVWSRNRGSARRDGSARQLPRR